MSIPRMSTAAILLIALPATAPAAPTGVAELLRQGEYWAAKGRGDLSAQAYRRALAVDPGNVAARRGLQAATPAPARLPPRAAPPPALPRPAEPAARALPRAALPGRRAAPAPVDGGAQARAAGFAALERNDLAAATQRFQAAIRARPNDADALGGLGIVRLRTRRFAEARDLLARASRGGSPAQWAEALGAARFYAGLQTAERARDAGRLDEAAVQARGLEASDGGEAAAVNALLADIAGRQGRFAEAATLYGTAAATTPRAPAAADLRGRAALAQARQAALGNDPAGADRAFRAAIESDPADPWARYEHARFLLGQNRQAAAAAAIQPLEQRVSPEALYAGALFWNQAGQPARADGLMARIPADQRTAAMTGFMREARIAAAIAQARALHGQGRTNEAAAGLRMVAAYPGLSVALLGQLAAAFRDIGDPGEARAIAQQALALPLAAPESYGAIVPVLAQDGQDDSMTALIERLVAADGGRTTPAIGRLAAGLAAARADRLRLAGQNAQAFDLLRGAWADAPDDRDILAALARLYQGGGMGAQALAVYDMLLRRTPDDVGLLIGVADAASIARDRPRARDAAGRATRLQPGNPDTWLAAARVEQAIGDKGAALRYLKHAREVFAGKATLAGGAAFPAGNPFADGFGPGAAPPANPFADAGRETDAVAMRYPAASPFAPLPAPRRSRGSAAMAPLPVAFAAAAPFPAAPPAMPGSPYDEPAGVGDPTLQRINREIAALSTDSGPWVSASPDIRVRSGEKGLSRLTELGAKAEIGTSFGSDGRVSIGAAPVVLDAGGLGRSALARFGRNPTAEAAGIAAALPSRLAAARTQRDTGVAFSAKASHGALSADVGTTPVGFTQVDVQGSLAWEPRIGPDTQVRIHAERRPVTDSVLAYAGTRDPVTGAYWGKVMRSGGGGSVSFDRNGNGVYADAAYRTYRGRAVRRNAAIEANVGGYLSLRRNDDMTLTAGANLNYQSYDNDQNYFSYGHGGYFSPQRFVSLAFPLRYTGTFGDLAITADAAPGYQSYDQDGAPVYPTRAAEQAVLDAAKALNPDVRSRYDATGRSGLGFSGGVGATYRIGDATRVGGEVRYNTFGRYNEFQTNLKITQSIGGQ